MAQAVVLREEIEIPEGINVNLDDGVTVKGSKGQLNRKFNYPNVIIKKEDDKLVLESNFPKKKR